MLGAGLSLTSFSITPPATDVVGNAIVAASPSVGAINAALTLTLTGPSSGTIGTPSTNFTVTASSVTSDTITLSDASSGGLFTPASAVLASTTTTTFTYTSVAPGVITLTATSGLGTSVTGSPFSYTSSTSYLWRFVQSNSAQTNGGTTTPVALAARSTFDNVIVAALTVGSGGTPTVTDSQGNTYTNIGTSGNLTLWLTRVTANTFLTVTASSGIATSRCFAVTEYSFAPGCIFTTENPHTNTGTGTAVSITSVAVTKPDVVVMASNQFISSGVSTAGSGFTKRQSILSLFGTPGVFFQDNLNPAASPVASALTLASSANWAAAGIGILATLPPYELTGPTSVASGSAGLFTLAPTATISSDTITFSDGGAGGAFAPTSLTFTSTLTPKTFTYTPAIPGLLTLTLASSASNTIGANPWAIGSYVNFTLTGPTDSGFKGVASSFTLAPASATTDTVTFSDAGAGGVFSPTSLTWASSGATQGFTYTPPAAGTQTITIISADGAPVAGSPFALTSVAVVVGPYISKSGKIVQFGCAASSGATNGAYPLAPVTAVNSSPAIKLNGVTVSIGPATWWNSSQNCPAVAFLLQCGSVESISMSNGGHGYTAPAASWNGDGGGSGLTVGTPTMARGITSYTIDTPGSGLTDGEFDFGWVNQSAFNIPNATGVPATARITVSGGQVVSCVPRSGSPIAYGGGYTGNGFSSTTFFPSGIHPAQDKEPGSSPNKVGIGANITANISNYIAGIPVVNHGTGFTSYPTFTITDGGAGTGAVAAPIMTGAQSTDSITYSWAAGGLTTTLGTTAAATNAVVTNYAGVLEGPVGNLSGYRATPTMPFGVWISPQFYSFAGWSWPVKNKYHVNGGWGKGSGTSVLTLDSNLFPVSWTAGGQIGCTIVLGGLTGALPYGNWTFIYDDAFYASGAPAATTFTVGISNGASGGTPTISRVGTAVTQVINVTQTGKSSACNISITLTAPSDGLMHVSGITVIPPNNTIDRTLWAPDDYYVNNLTGATGTCPADVRFMASIGGHAGWNNLVDWSDNPPSTLDSFSLPASYRVRTISIAAVRNWSTDGSKSWVTTKLYSGSLTTQAPWAVSGSDGILGSYLDMTAGPLGAADNGTIAMQGNGGLNRANLECRTASPHGLKTGQYITFGGTLPTIPLSVSGNQLLTNSPPVAAFVTGPTTFGVELIYLGISGTTPPGGFQTINSSSEIATPGLTAAINVPWAADFLPYEAQAKLVAAFPGTDMWVNVGPIATHDYITQCITTIAANLGPTNGIKFERGNEYWNYNAEGFGLEYFWELAYARFAQYAPSGQPFLTYAHGGNNIGIGNNIFINAVASADAGTVALAAWIAAGRLAGKFTPVYGSQWQAANRTSDIGTAITNYSMPTGAIAVAPYQDIDYNQSTITTAMSSAGDVVETSAGNWPIDAWLDLYRTKIFYNPLNWSSFSSQLAALHAGCTTVSYEGAFQQMLDVPSIGMGNYTEEDMFNHPLWYDAIWCFALAMQQGNPTVAGSGLQLLTYSGTWSSFNTQRYGSIMLLEIGGDGTCWRFAQSSYMDTGRGLSNKFLTPQGGASGADASTRFGWSQVNQAPGVQALVDWNAVNTTVVATTNAKSFVIFLT